jgi:hypothetical protein
LAPGSLDPQTEVVINKEKSAMLARVMFPGKPRAGINPGNPEYDNQLQNWGNIMPTQICRNIDKLSPHKATGTDKIPNIVLKKCAGTIIPFLTQIYRAVFSLSIYVDHGKKSSCAYYESQESHNTTPQKCTC